jgi:hypothetical protein
LPETLRASIRSSGRGVERHRHPAHRARSHHRLPGPELDQPPTASNLNFSTGETIPNLVIVPVEPDGNVELYNNSAGSVHLVVDLFGWVGP